eukprot:1882341-Rhodomonas_salina.1
MSPTACTDTAQQDGSVITHSAFCIRHHAFSTPAHATRMRFKMPAHSKRAPDLHDAERMRLEPRAAPERRVVLEREQLQHVGRGFKEVQKHLDAVRFQVLLEQRPGVLHQLAQPRTLPRVIRGVGQRTLVPASLPPRPPRPALGTQRRNHHLRDHAVKGRDPRTLHLGRP